MRSLKKRSDLLKARSPLHSSRLGKTSVLGRPSDRWTMGVPVLSSGRLPTIGLLSTDDESDSSLFDSDFGDFGDDSEGARQRPLSGLMTGPAHTRDKEEDRKLLSDLRGSFDEHCKIIEESMHDTRKKTIVDAKSAATATRERAVEYERVSRQFFAASRPLVDNVEEEYLRLVDAYERAQAKAASHAARIRDVWEERRRLREEFRRQVAEAQRDHLAAGNRIFSAFRADKTELLKAVANLKEERSLKSSVHDALGHFDAPSDDSISLLAIPFPFSLSIRAQAKLADASTSSSYTAAGRSLAEWERFFQRHGGAGNAPRRGSSEIAEGLTKLRRLILVEGVPSDEHRTVHGITYRALTWKLLLGVHRVSAPRYLQLVARGRSAVHEKIRNDTFRTLATDRGFKQRVAEDKLIRLLEAFVWKNYDTYQHSSHLDFTYVQGMNVLAAPFLYTLPSELEAFHCFSRFIEVCCPLYVQPTLEGVHRGLQLLDRCLEIADPTLFRYLRSKNLSAEIYAFPSVLTLCACTPPLDQVLHLWDFLLAFGVHLNVLCVIAQLLLIREDVMNSPSPMKILRQFPPLQAQPIIAIAVTLVRDLPSELYEELVRHPFDPPGF